MKSKKGVLYLRYPNGVSEWCEDGDEENDGKYLGIIKNGEPNGQGTITSPDRVKYVGEWKDDKKNGHGTWTLPHGQKYEGELKDDKFWNGTDYDKNGNIIESWLNGVKQK